MEESIWTFERGTERLELRRQPTENGVLLVVVGDGPERSYFFAEVSALVPFQSDMEQFLLKTGWSFLCFSPDRRQGRDRRRWPREDERRRWWTDGTQAKPIKPRRRKS